MKSSLATRGEDAHGLHRALRGAVALSASAPGQAMLGVCATGPVQHQYDLRGLVIQVGDGLFESRHARSASSTGHRCSAPPTLRRDRRRERRRRATRHRTTAVPQRRVEQCAVGARRLEQAPDSSVIRAPRPPSGSPGPRRRIVGRPGSQRSARLRAHASSPRALHHGANGPVLQRPSRLAPRRAARPVEPPPQRHRRPEDLRTQCSSARRSPSVRACSNSAGSDLESPSTESSSCARSAGNAGFPPATPRHAWGHHARGRATRCR